MKLLVDGKYKEVGFWSFMKCTVLVQLAMAGLFYGALFAIGIIFGLMLL